MAGTQHLEPVSSSLMTRVRLLATGVMSAALGCAAHHVGVPQNALQGTSRPAVLDRIKPSEQVHRWRQGACEFTEEDGMVRMERVGPGDGGICDALDGLSGGQGI